jgi:hypothetical protein
VPPPSFRFSKGYDEQTVQFLIIEMLDSIRQVFRQDMPSPSADETRFVVAGDVSSIGAVEKRSEFVWWVGSRPMRGGCRDGGGGGKWWRVVSLLTLAGPHAQRSTSASTLIACLLFIDYIPSRSSPNRIPIPNSISSTIAEMFRLLPFLNWPLV